MKLNTKQPYGHVYGNHAASFIQNGKFFDGSGAEIDEEGLEKPDGSVDDVDRAKQFLTDLLTGTKVSKAQIVKAAEVEGHSWHQVEEAADLLGVVKFKVGVVQNWKLSEE